VEIRRQLDWLDRAILSLTAILIVAVVWLNDSDASSPVVEDVSRVRLPPSVAAGWMPWKRAENDFEAFLAVATLGLGFTVLSHPGRLRTKDWPPPGHTAMAVGVLAELFMIAWHISLNVQGQYWLDRRFAHLIVLSAVSRIRFRIAGAIVGAWVVLAFSRRFRPRPELLDRLGCIVAASWIGVIVIRLTWPRFWFP
jgi:hypothetical protein